MDQPYNPTDAASLRFLTGLSHFLAVAETGGFRAAARRLGLTPATVSQAVAGLEARIGTPLLVRTTRSVRLTDAGRRMMEAGSAAQALLRDATDDICNAAGPSGTLRLCIGRSALPLIETCIPAYLAHHPLMAIEIEVRDGPFDILSGGFDAGIRIGEFVAPDMVAVRLCRPVAWAVVASPDYLRGRDALREPADLTQHQCLRFRPVGAAHEYRWEFVDRQGRSQTICPSGRILCNDARLLRSFALASCGLAYIARDLVEPDIRAGALRTVLEEWMPPQDDLLLYYPRSGGRQPKLRAWIDLVRDFIGRRQAAVAS